MAEEQTWQKRINQQNFTTEQYMLAHNWKHLQGLRNILNTVDFEDPASALDCYDFMKSHMAFADSEHDGLSDAFAHDVRTASRIDYSDLQSVVKRLQGQEDEGKPCAAEDADVIIRGLSSIIETQIGRVTSTAMTLFELPSPEKAAGKLQEVYNQLHSEHQQEIRP